MAKISTFSGHYGPKNQNFENPCIMFLYHPKMNQHAKFHGQGTCRSWHFCRFRWKLDIFLKCMGFPIYFNGIKFRGWSTFRFFADFADGNTGFLVDFADGTPVFFKRQVGILVIKQWGNKQCCSRKEATIFSKNSYKVTHLVHRQKHRIRFVGNVFFGKKWQISPITPFFQMFRGDLISRMTAKQIFRGIKFCGFSRIWPKSAKSAKFNPIKVFCNTPLAFAAAEWQPLGVERRMSPFLKLER